MSFPTILIIAAAIIAAAFFSRKAPANSKKTQVAVFCLLSLSFTIILLIVVSITGSLFRSASNTTVDNHARQAERVALVEDKQPTPEELAEQQRFAEEKRLAEEKRRQQEEIRQQRLAEERAVREAERDAMRMYVDEINAGFLYGLGINDMGTPRRQMSGQDEILTYPLDKTGELDLVEITTNGKVKSATITIHKFNRDSFVAGVIFYAALIEVFVPPSDANDILGALGLDETIVDTITENRSTVVNHYRFAKSVVNKKIILSVTEQ